MFAKTTKARVGAKATVAMAKHPALRRAALKAGVPSAKLLAKRQARSRLEPIGSATRTAGSIVVAYAPIAGEALGIVEAPKPKRRAPAIAAASLLAAAALLLLRRRG
jgi:hypothetical protein